jgi:DNA-binding CsgD family transcriptional regulator
MMGLAALDLLDIGVLVTDVTRRVLFANQKAGQLLAARDGISLSAASELMTLRRCKGQSLSDVMQHAADSPEADDSQPAVMAVSRPSGKRPLTLLIRPARGNGSTAPAQRAMLVFVLDPESPAQFSDTGLRILHRLTNSEARLASRLMDGKTLEECCDDLGIRCSTARMHLGNLFAKTGVQRQGQLVSLLLKSVGPIRMDSRERGGVRVGSGTNDAAVAGGTENRAGRFASQAPVAGLEALEVLNLGVMVTNAAGEVRLANSTAERILAAQDGLQLIAGSLSCHAVGEDNGRLREVLRKAAHGERGTAAPAILPVRRPGKKPLTLVVSSTERKPLQRILSWSGVLVLILDPDLPARSPDAELRRLYGFTHTEARLASLLMDGRTLEACCECLDVRSSTARMHLANMFAKTGVQRQGQLVSLLLKSVGVLRQPWSDAADSVAALAYSKMSSSDAPSIAG